MTARLWLVPLAMLAGGAAGPFLAAAITRALVRREESGPISKGLGLSRTSIAWLSLTLAVLEGLAGLRLGASWTFPPVAVFLAGAAALAWCDGHFMLLPKTIHYRTLGSAALLLVVAAAGTGRWSELGTATACGAAAFTVFFALNLINPRAMAFGDVRLAGMIGLVAGWFGPGRALLAFVVASLAGAVTAVVLLVARRIGLRSYLPYGVFLALGAAAAVLA